MRSPQASKPGLEAGRKSARRHAVLLCFIALSVSYCVFVSGIYVNLFVTGPVFSLPLDFQLAAFRQAEATTPFLLHEVLGGALLASLAALAVFLWVGGTRRLSLVAAIATLLVAYSAYVGSLNIASPLAPTPPGLASVAIPMLSAAAFIGAIVATMLVTLSFRKALGVRSDVRKP